MKNPHARADLAGIPVYKPGRPSADGQRSFKLSSNESPYPPLPSVLEAIADAAQHTNRYPDLAASAVVQALADKLDVPAEHVVVGCGSVGVATQLVEAFAGPGDEVVYAWRSFEAYPIIVQVAGATAVPVPLTSGAVHDLDAMSAAITPRTRVVLVCNPNNPTGTAVRRAPLESFLDAVPSDCLVVLDEAYREFNRDPEVPDAVIALPRAAQRRCPADLLEGLWAGGPAGRLRGSASRSGRRDSHDQRALRGELDRAGRGSCVTTPSR